MKTLLVIAEHPGLAEAISAAVSASYKVTHRTGIAEAEPLLVHGLADLCVLDLDLIHVQAIWVLEKVRAWAPACPIIIFTGQSAPEWEEEAYLKGAAHVMSKPVRPRIFAALLERLLPNGTTSPNAPTQATAAPRPPVSSGTSDTQFLASLPLSGVPATAHTLSVLRDFSSVLTHSLDAESLLKEFLLLLREILGVNRAAIFLRAGVTGAGSGATLEARRLRAVSAIGLSQGLLQHFELSLDAGIGGQLQRSGRILRRQSEEARADIEAQKEFELLGTQVAIPVLDRESVIGVAVFDGRITGEPLLNPELELVFHLLEQVGLAVRNTWLHQQLTANNKMLGEILRELSSACVVVGSDLSILHANKIARKHFGRASEGRSGELEFSDLPQLLGARVYQVLKNGAGISNLRYEPEDGTGTVLRVNIVPFQREGGGLPSSALLIAEDISHSEHLRVLEVENASLRLVQNMARRMTAEIGNAMVPVSTLQQLILERWKDPDFRNVLVKDLGDVVKRVTRLLNQLRSLADKSARNRESVVIADVVEEAYRDACRFQQGKDLQLDKEGASAKVVVHGDRIELKNAFSEVMLNALQANPADPRVQVHFRLPSNGERPRLVQIEVEDNGPGFSTETAQNATQPFFAGRVPGVGLGLTVTQHVIENHGGKLELVPAQRGLVRISLPVENTAA